MFAPGSGRYLGSGLLVLLALLILAFAVPHSGQLPLAVAFVVGAMLWAFFAWFFRDPERAAGEAIVSAADGRVQGVTVEGERLRIAVFMNVTDVHVNRFPLDASVRSIETAGSGFRPAYAPEAHHNLRRHYLLQSALGEVEVVQMTGIVARRLVSLVHADESHRKSDRLGMILLGSRVDVLLPRARVEAQVRVGDRVRAGVTTIARERP
ncbi:MAG: phosphatidylserine decarboxylase [Thermoplasmata archaeon]|nr:phosphatidylserine decarboxylase [Thermoplasmata archaeon]